MKDDHVRYKVTMEIETVADGLTTVTKEWSGLIEEDHRASWCWCFGDAIGEALRAFSGSTAHRVFMDIFEGIHSSAEDYEIEYEKIVK